MAILVKVTGHLVTFGWPCQCVVVFKTKGRRPLLAAELDEDFDIWSIAERRQWQWISETACSLHGGFEVRHYRNDEGKRGGRSITTESALAIRDALMSLDSHL